MATVTVKYVVTLEADAEHTEDEKVAEVTQLAKDQAQALRIVYDEGIDVTGTIKIVDSDEEPL